MGCDRRDFIKLAGLTTLAGLTLRPGLAALAAPGRYRPREAALQAKRWAMVVDTRRCQREQGCRDCIAACHRTHNVPHFPNPKDEIKWIWKEPFGKAFPEQEQAHLREDLHHFEALVFCNHCENPPCVRVCPTQATWKRDDGIVMMDWHRCIGCRYCVAACPYGSRSFNWRDPKPHLAELDPDFPHRVRGVVEKCTFCEERLSRGLLPACVEACPAKALTFGDLEAPESEVRELLRTHFTIRRKPVLGTDPAVYYIV